MKKGCLFVILAVLVVGLLGVIVGNLSNDSSQQTIEEKGKNEKVPVLIDVNQFSRISAEELVKIMGEPKSKDKWTNKTSRGEFLIEIYEYDGYDFFIADNSVVGMNIYSEKYYDCKGVRTKEYILKRKLMKHLYCQNSNTIFIET